MNLSMKNLGELRKSNKNLFDNFIRKSEVPKWTRLLLWACDASMYSKDLTELSTRILLLWTRSGEKFIVLYLKECTRLMQQCLSGNPSQSSSGGILVKARKGLPTIIPTKLREQIRLNNNVVTRSVMTMLSLYRIIYCTPDLKLSPITRPFTGTSQELPMVDLVLRYFKLPDKLLSIKFSRSMKTGPNYRFSILGSALDASAMIFHPKIFLSMVRLSSWYKRGYLFILLLFLVGIINLPISIWDKSPFRIGKLGKKLEAAGKVRIFAMTDWWTQSLLISLHDRIYTKLRSIRQDGTMDQSGPLYHLRDISRGLPAYSYDLSSATDRLPSACQAQLLDRLVGEGFGKWWKILLTDRNWFLKDVPLRYAVGQPMGAYSSFGMLALTHHYIVQLSAYNVGYRYFFPHYALLGDDIVIANKAVAESYLSIMKDLGVEINLSKSLQSERGTFEFAKRLLTPGGEVTPLGAKNLLVGLRRWNYVPSLLLDSRGKGVTMTPSSVSRMICTLNKYLTIRKKDVGILKLMLLGPTGVFSNEGTEMIFSMPFSYQVIVPSVVDSLVYGFMSICIKDLQRAINDARTSMTEFFKVGVRDFRSWFNPGFWIVARELELSYERFHSLDYSNILSEYMSVVKSGYAQNGWVAFNHLVANWELPVVFSLKPLREEDDKGVMRQQVVRSQMLRKEFRHALHLSKITMYPIVVADGLKADSHYEKLQYRLYKGAPAPFTRTVLWFNSMLTGSKAFPPMFRKKQSGKGAQGVF